MGGLPVCLYSRSKLSCGSRHYIKASFNDRMGIKDFDQLRYYLILIWILFDNPQVIAKSFEVTDLPNKTRWSRSGIRKEKTHI
ncbi:hypothetical protein YC2023_028900 [Brassica napus]